MPDIAVPAGGRLPGVRMAGFRGRAAEPVSWQLIPYPAITLIVDFGDARLVDASSREWRGGIVIGLDPRNVRGGGRDVDLLQVRLSPLMAYQLLGLGLELRGAVAALADLWGGDAARTQERLRTATSWRDRFAIVEAALARRYAVGRAPDPEVAFGWRRMVTSRGRLRVERLAAEVGWSRKRLWSRFRDQIGLSPKRAASLIRFDHVAHRLAAGHDAASVAAESGFADQSHLCREVGSFTGLTPRAVAAAPWLSVDSVAWP